MLGHENGTVSQQKALIIDFNQNRFHPHHSKEEQKILFLKQLDDATQCSVDPCPVTLKLIHVLLSAEESAAVLRTADAFKWETLELCWCAGDCLDQFIEAALLHFASLEILQLSNLVWGLTQISSVPCNLRQVVLKDCELQSPVAASSLELCLQMCEKTLDVLVLARCGLPDETLSVILRSCPESLRVLDVSGNFCRTKGVKVISTLLSESHRNLQKINLSSQHPGERGGDLDLSELYLALSTNQTLLHLDISFNMLFLAGVVGLVKALEENRTCRSTNLMGNCLDDSAIQRIGNRLPHLRGLRHINILSNRFGEDGATSLLHGLWKNVVLSSLIMPRGFLASEDIDHFLALNRGGRRLLVPDQNEPSTPLPLSVWVSVLARVNHLYEDQKDTRTNVLFYLIQGPLFLCRGAS